MISWGSDPFCENMMKEGDGNKKNRFPSSFTVKPHSVLLDEEGWH
jgi:hypothetical protein